MPEETFYGSLIPRPTKPGKNPSLPRSPVYQFRQQSTQINPLALRRLQLQDVMSQRREEAAAGKQELDAIKEMAHLEQNEYSIRQQIAKEKQVASAQREVSKLDPETDPHFQQSYAEIMSRHPLAQDNKFLNEAFTDGAKVNYRVAQHKFNELEEGQKQGGREALETQKQVGKEDLQWIKATGAYAAMGGDPSAFTDKDGMHDWNALNSAHAKAVQATQSAAANAGLPISKTVTKAGDTTITREAPKSELSTAQKIGIAKMEGTMAGQLAQQQVFQKQADANPNDMDVKKNLTNVTANLALTKGQVDAVHGVVNPPPPVVAPPIAAPAADQPTPPTASPVPPDSAPPPVTSTSAAPPAAAVDYLKSNPHFAPHFDSKYGANASTEFLTE
jgi:hypothetical protein